MTERKSCDKRECFACYDGQCFIACSFIDDLIEDLEHRVAFVKKNNGAGAVGALSGTLDYLKEQRREGLK